ncbi:unnamed protein product [Calypogeia fissa]
METIGRVLVACVLLFTLAIAGPDSSADARMMAEWNIPCGQDVDRPMNLSGNSVGSYFEVPVENKSAKENEEGWDVNISFPPGFDTVNNMLDSIRVQCENSYPSLAPIILVDELVLPGMRCAWPLYLIDPGSLHVTYQCTWQIPFTDQYIRRTAWADANHQSEMPISCAHCIWAVQDDGLYIFNYFLASYQKVMPWCTPASPC